MLDICQAKTHETNMDLYRIADERPISEMIREYQLKFIRYCLHMPKDEPANIYVIYQSKIRRSNRHGNPGLTYLAQISKYLSTDKTVRFSAEEIANYTKDKQLWNWVLPCTSYPPDDDDEDDDEETTTHWNLINFECEKVLSFFSLR